MDRNPGSSKVDRKTIEKNRRNQLKTLYSELNSLVPRQTTKEILPVPDQLEEAANYIKDLQRKLEKMKQKKICLMGFEKSGSMLNNHGANGGIKFPDIGIHVTGSAMEVVLITALDCQFMFKETIQILHEEGAEVVNASFSTLDDKIIHTMHAKLGGSGSEHEAARISQRLTMFFNLWC